MFQGHIREYKEYDSILTKKRGLDKQRGEDLPVITKFQQLSSSPKLQQPPTSLRYSIHHWQSPIEVLHIAASTRQRETLWNPTAYSACRTWRRREPLHSEPQSKQCRIRRPTRNVELKSCITCRTPIQLVIAQIWFNFILEIKLNQHILYRTIIPRNNGVYAIRSASTPSHDGTDSRG